MHRFALLAIVLVVGCGDDAKMNGPKDAPPITVDIDNGSCGDQLRFTGEVVDWDETPANFCGLGDANVMDGADGGMDTTAPNGRFDLCVPSGDAQRALTVTAAAGASQCDSHPGTYVVTGILVETKAVIETGVKTSGRMFTEERKTSFFAEMGVAYDATKAQVLVHVEGVTTRAASLTAQHDPPYSLGATWVAGDTGKNIFFPNVAVGAGTTDLAVAGGAVGTGSIPIAANTITMVTVNAQ